MKNEELNKFIALFENWEDATIALCYKRETNYFAHTEPYINYRQYIGIPSYLNIALLISEIETNLYSLSESSKEVYIESIIMKFKKYVEYQSPIAIGAQTMDDIKNKVVPSPSAYSFIPYKDNIYELFKYDNDVICERVDQRELLANEIYLITCRWFLEEFAGNLDVLCIPFNIDIEDIQNRKGVKLRKYRDWILLGENGHQVSFFGLKDYKLENGSFVEVEVKDEKHKSMETEKREIDTPQLIQTLAIEYLLSELGVSTASIDKTRIAEFMQFITGRKDSTAPKDSNFYKQYGKSATDSKKGKEEYNKRCDIVAERFSAIGLEKIATKLQNSKETE